MSYRYKQDFGKCFYNLPLPQHEGTTSHPLIELDEVYRKAEAWDKLEFILKGEIIEANPVYSNDGTKKADAPINVKIEAWESILMSMQDLVSSIKSEEDSQ